MEPSRNEAKKGIVNKDANDPEFIEKQKSAHQFQLDLTKEQNKHEKEMKSTELGLLGRFFGDGRHTQTFVALVAVFVGLAIFASCLYAAYKKPAEAQFWSDSGLKALAFAGTCVGYLFGKTVSNSRR